MGLKIAYILKMYPRFSETFILNELLELERQGVDIRIYSLRKPDDGRFHANLARVKAGVIYLPEYPDKELPRVRAAEARLRAAHPDAYVGLRAYAESRGHPYAIKRFQQACIIAAHLLEYPVYAMHAHFASSASRVSNYVQRLIGLPYSFTAHAKDIYHQEVNPKSLRGKIRNARFVVTVSRYNQSYLSQLTEGVGDVRLLYNGVDLNTFRPGSNEDRQAGLVVGVGRLVEKKGFDTLVRACDYLRQWDVPFRCEIIGKGEERRSLNDLIESLDLGQLVELAGPKPQEDVLAALHKASIFALPCIIGRDGNRDGLPTVLLEAMATGLPAISTPVTGIPEIIEDGKSGFLVPPGDAEALARALAELLREQQRRAAMGQAARLKVERQFNVQNNVAELHQWLAEPLTDREQVAPAAPSLAVSHHAGESPYLSEIA